MMEKVVLADGESIEIVVADGVIEIDSTGLAKVATGNYGYTNDLFNGNAEGSRFTSGTLGVYEPSKAEKIQQYLLMLFEANKSGHKTNDEIGEALKQYKSELEI